MAANMSFIDPDGTINDKVYKFNKQEEMLENLLNDQTSDIFGRKTGEGGECCYRCIYVFHKKHQHTSNTAMKAFFLFQIIVEIIITLYILVFYWSISI